MLVGAGSTLVGSGVCIAHPVGSALCHPWDAHFIGTPYNASRAGRHGKERTLLPPMTTLGLHGRYPSPPPPAPPFKHSTARSEELDPRGGTAPFTSTN
jgi:hypothetical protein